MYVDDCCKQWNKIQEMFGKNVSVKLDLFHAIQRITKTISKKHPYFYSCIQDLRLVFRSKGDCEERRLFATPCINEIHQNLKSFIDKWKDKAEDGIKVFKPETLKAIENLKKHIDKGCLSNIPPGGGTNKNERLHEHIHNYFNHSRIGMLLAYALLHMIIHAHNTAILTKGKRVTHPIEASPFILNKSKNNTAIGIVRKSAALSKNEDHWEIDLSQNNIESDLEIIVEIYQNAIDKFKVFQCLNKEKLANMSLDINVFQQYKPYDNDIVYPNFNHKEPSSYGLAVISTKPNGNCFFQAIAINIANNANLSNINNLFPESDLKDTDTMVVALRKTFVTEILSQNQSLYNDFIPCDANDFVAEAQKFLESGYFNSMLGDLMPLAIATALKVTIFILSPNIPSTPLYVIPLCGEPIGMIFLVHDSTAGGHYDAAIPYSCIINQSESDLQVQVRKISQVFCNCGVNKKNDQKSCVSNPSYASRCKCYAQHKPCSSSCRCKNCSNPYGARPQKPAGIKRPMQITLPTSKSLLKIKGKNYQLECGQIFNQFAKRNS